MPESPTSPELLRSLGHLVRGLSALFWGMPLALILAIQTGRFELLRSFSIAPTVAMLGLIVYGLGQMGHFQKQERPWRLALDRARLLALVNLGHSPFLFWWSRMPEQPLFGWAVGLLVLCGILFLFNLNGVLQRLAAMLPDETLRHETRQFTAVNRGLLLVLLVLTGAYLLLSRLPGLPFQVVWFLMWIEHFSLWLLIPLMILPLAMSMALIWKAKEVIMESLFHPGH